MLTPIEVNMPTGIWKRAKKDFDKIRESLKRCVCLQMKNKLILAFFLLISLFVNNLFALSIDEKIPYRLYIGGDKKVDWIDICRTGYLNIEGNFITEFEDLTPIQKIYEQAGNFWIIKEKSIWVLFKIDTFPYWQLSLNKRFVTPDVDSEFRQMGMHLIRNRK